MNKKDRIAIVITFGYLIFGIVLLIDSSRGDRSLMFLICVVPLLVYWGYRFIKGNISFLNQNSDN